MFEQIGKRQEANLKIASILKGSEHSALRVIANRFAELAKQYPQQRAGQIICNYICDDYRCGHTSALTVDILNLMFPGDPDPFFEESVVTLKRLITK